MLATPATLGEAPLRDPNLVYEPKYDGIRVIATIEPGGGRVALSSRLGNDKTAQFPEVAQALARWASRRRGAAVLDGEIVALDAAGRPATFQRLQDRIHLTSPREIARLAAQKPVAFVVFDLLRDGGRDLCARPLAERRRRLEKAVPADPAGVLRLAPQAAGDGRALYAQAEAEGWEGLIVKDARSIYAPGERSRAWRKLKLVRRQELAIGGWTEPRRSRASLGALLLGVPEGDGKRLRYVGHAGSGFTEKELGRLGRLLRERETATCPFTATPVTNERPHWVRPELVAEIKFTEWTDEGLMRHPTYLGLRDDVVAASVRREGQENAAPPPDGDAGASPLVAALAELERGRGSGRLALPGGGTLEVSNLGKVLWPKLGVTKGQLLRYYATVAPALLPVVRDRPLVMRRFPDGVERPAFYQHRAPAKLPAGVRAEAVPGADVPSQIARTELGLPSGVHRGRVQEPSQGSRMIVGGGLATLLYMAQLGAISQDPWFSRAHSPAEMDFAALDLDPMPGASWKRVLDVARWVRDELGGLGVEGFPKTSGASGLHVFVPLPAGTPYEAGLLFCQIVATLVARRHPAAATVERFVKNRPDDVVYVDYLQNIQGKTLACAYSARASDWAGASAPVTWREVDEGVDARDFTLATLPARLREVGDLWERLRRAPGADLEAALELVRSRGGG